MKLLWKKSYSIAENAGHPVSGDTEGEDKDKEEKKSN